MRQMWTAEDWQASQRGSVPPVSHAEPPSSFHLPPMPQRQAGAPRPAHRDPRRWLRLAVLCALWLALLAWPTPQIGHFLSTHVLSNPVSGLIDHGVSSLPGGVESFIATDAPHQYWQVGLAASADNDHATGMRTSIETVLPQRVSADTTNYYWIGAYLSDGSFIQAGYYVPSADDTRAGWFYCAFTHDGNEGPCVYGALGSIANTGDAHTYTLETVPVAAGAQPQWNVLVDGHQVGRFEWTAGDTGANTPAIYAESSGFTPHAATSQLGPVSFSGIQLRRGAEERYVAADHVRVVYNATNVCPPYGVAMDDHGGARLGSGLACPTRWSQLW